jgi:hypothetical protein
MSLFSLCLFTHLLICTKLYLYVSYQYVTILSFPPFIFILLSSLRYYYTVGLPFHLSLHVILNCHAPHTANNLCSLYYHILAYSTFAHIYSLYLAVIHIITLILLHTQQLLFPILLILPLFICNLIESLLISPSITRQTWLLITEYCHTHNFSSHKLKENSMLLINPQIVRD